MSNPLLSEAALIMREGGMVAFTGAGISTASGIPDYRGPKGLWKIFDPKDFTIDVFLREPEYYWSKRLERKRVTGFDVLDAKPNPAHDAVTRLQRAGLLREIITQNTDGLHQKSGSADVIELHGNSSKLICVDCGSKYPTREFESEFERSGRIPLCPSCSRALKPDVVLFGEQLNPRDLELSSRAVSTCRTILVIGTTASVYPAAMYPRIAKKNGAMLIEITESETELSSQFADLSIFGDCSRILPKIVDNVLPLP